MIYNDVYNQRISGLVLDKFYDSANHNHMTIAYSEGNDDTKSMIIVGETGEIFEFVNVGDSLIKKPNSVYYKIKYKTSGKDTLIKIETDCKDTVRK